MFHPWPRLPPELKLEILQYAVAQQDPFTHSRHLDNIRAWLLSPFISTRNEELVQLAIDAYYKFNTFLIAPHVLHTTFAPRSRLLRPKPQHAQKIQHLVFRMITCFPYMPPLRALQHYTHDELASVLNRQIRAWFVRRSN